MIAHKLFIPYVGCIPFIGQESLWSAQDQKTYKLLCKLASDQVIVSSGGYSADKMQIRNRYLVDNCDILLACINPNETSGGTFNCVEYAKSVNRIIVYINPYSS